MLLVPGVARNGVTYDDCFKRSVAEIKQSFLLEYKYSIAALCGSALLIGLILGYLGYKWIQPKPEEIRPTVPASQSASSTPNSPRSQPSHKKHLQPNRAIQSQ